MRGFKNGLWRYPSPLKRRISRDCFVCDVGPSRHLTIDSRNRMSNVFTLPTMKTRQRNPNKPPDVVHDAGLIRQSAAGIYYLLPLGVRIQDKIRRLADEAMKRVGASKLELPALSARQLWRQSGRWTGPAGSELFKVEDRKGSRFCLAPTHEEDITSLIASGLQSWRTLPVRVYQIGTKYRDEKRPRKGLLRAREFLMKDMYSFDMDENTAMKTYEEVRAAYDWFFGQIGLPFVTVEAKGGHIGGTICHEYHYISEDGEDTLYLCKSCNYAKNSELHLAEEDNAETHLAKKGDAKDLAEEDHAQKCPVCKEDSLETFTAIELGHTFYLGTQYSSIFGAQYMSPDDPSVLETTHMGCYGLGLSRMIASIAKESQNDTGIIWPESVAPWNCIVITANPSDDEPIYDGLVSILGTDNVLFDDRPKMSIGWRLQEAERIGFPHIVVLGKLWLEAGEVIIIHRISGSTDYVKESVLLDPGYWKSVTSTIAS